MTIRISRQLRVARVLGALLPCLVVGATLSAADAPIPIDAPIVISESGSYVVTQDFTAVGQSAIRFDSDHNITVTIDFAGHSVGATGAPVIMARDGHETGCPTISLHDGRVVTTPGAGPSSGVYSWTTFAMSCRVTVSATNMTFENAGAWVEDGTLSVLSSHFINASMEADSNRGGGYGDFENNDVSGGNIVSGGTSGTIIRHNTIRAGSIDVHGRDGFSADYNRVEDNLVIGGSLRIGQVLTTYGVSHIVVRGNDVSGVLLVNDTYDPSILQNRVRGCSPSGSGISVTGFTRIGMFDGNSVTGACAYGLFFDFITRGNIYQNNVFPNVTLAPVYDEGVSNHDGGGNKPISAPIISGPPIE